MSSFTAAVSLALSQSKDSRLLHVLLYVSVNNRNHYVKCALATSIKCSKIRAFT